MQKADKEIDVCGTCCPIPLIKVRIAVGGLNSGQTLQVTGDDPVFEESVRDFCDIAGYKILDTENNERKAVILIQI